mmetsp:Transcript_29744/g.71873  ORF Transcript_29744/g.71873 Transcript_29744/m.71873 type:complete len:295 (-) Transcript_29744:488-1372(-)
MAVSAMMMLMMRGMRRRVRRRRSPGAGRVRVARRRGSGIAVHPVGRSLWPAPVRVRGGRRVRRGHLLLLRRRRRGVAMAEMGHRGQRHGRHVAMTVMRRMVRGGGSVRRRGRGGRGSLGARRAWLGGPRSRCVDGPPGFSSLNARLDEGGRIARDDVGVLLRFCICLCSLCLFWFLFLILGRIEIISSRGRVDYYRTGTAGSCTSLALSLLLLLLLGGLGNAARFGILSDPQMVLLLLRRRNDRVMHRRMVVRVQMMMRMTSRRRGRGRVGVRIIVRAMTRMNIGHHRSRRRGL